MAGNGAKRRSAGWFGGKDMMGFLHRSWMKNQGFAGENFDGRPVIGIAKGPERHAGRERIYLPGRAPIELQPRDPLLYFLQRLRDEHSEQLQQLRSEHSEQLQQLRSLHDQQLRQVRARHDQLLADLRSEYEKKGKVELFDGLKDHLAWNASDASLAETAAGLDMSEVAVRVAVHRLRKRFRNRLEERITQTVDSDDEVEAELIHLMNVFQN